MSTVDNTEHLYLRNLAAGDYVLELKRKAGTQSALPVVVAWYMPDPQVLGDLDGDGWPDIAAARSEAPNGIWFSGPAVKK